MVSTDTEAYKVKPFVEKNKYTIPVLYSDGKIEADYKIQGTPTNLIIDRQGVIQFRHTGYDSSTDEVYKKKIQELLQSAASGGQ